MNRGHVAALEAELQRAGVEDWTWEANEHPKLRFTHAGEQRCVICSGTPSDKRAPLNEIAFLRRLLGLRAPRRTNGQASGPKLHRRHAEPVLRPPTLSVVGEHPGPWEPLREWLALHLPLYTR